MQIDLVHPLNVGHAACHALTKRQTLMYYCLYRRYDIGHFRQKKTGTIDSFFQHLHVFRRGLDNDYYSSFFNMSRNFVDNNELETGPII